jgi:catechol 2,3-dioxygenase-like lactoylglutathione lyase family enzyme
MVPRRETGKSTIWDAGFPPGGFVEEARVLDHVVIGVADIDRSRAFYEAALAPLGISVVLDRPGYIGFGDRRPFFFLADRDVTARAHVAFAATDRARCDLFHEAAIAAGGTDNGTPGPRPKYHEHYYGAFVLDPDGNNVEAVCHAPGP